MLSKPKKKMNEVDHKNQRKTIIGIKRTIIGKALGNKVVRLMNSFLGTPHSHGISFDYFLS